MTSGGDYPWLVPGDIEHGRIVYDPSSGCLVMRPVISDRRRRNVRMARAGAVGVSFSPP